MFSCFQVRNLIYYIRFKPIHQRIFMMGELPCLLQNAAGLCFPYHESLHYYAKSHCKRGNSKPPQPGSLTVVSDGFACSDIYTVYLYIIEYREPNPSIHAGLRFEFGCFYTQLLFFGACSYKIKSLRLVLGRFEENRC